MAGNTIAVSIVSDVKGMRKGIDDVNGRLSGFQNSASRAGKAARNLLGGIAVVAGVKALTGALGDCVSEAREAQKANKLTANLIKQTGGAAGISANGVGKLATAISNKAGIDDEAIQSGANVLLTFKKVRNEVGKGNQVYNRAVQAATDLSSIKGFGGMEGASKTLGKALGDPVKGIGALNKAGVNFTEGQKKKIKSLVAENKTLAAQKIILKEVESQVGGSAAAQATAGDKAKVAYENMKEAIGTALLPTLDKFFTFASDKLIPSLYKIPDIFRSLKGYIQPVIDLFKSFGGEGGNAGSRLTELQATVSSVWDSIKTIFNDGISIVKSLWAAFGGTITSYLRSSLTNTLTILRGLFQIIAGIFKTFSALLKGDWRGVWNGIKQIVRGAITVVGGIVRQLWNLIRSLFRAGGVVIKAVFKAAWDGIKSAARAGVNKVVDAVKGIKDKVKNGIGNLGRVLFNAGKAIMQGLLDGIGAMIGKLKGKLKKVTDLIPGNKGPISKDRVLLKPAGVAIIEGLIDGLTAQERALKVKLRQITRDVANEGGKIAVPEIALTTQTGRANAARLRQMTLQPANASASNTYEINVTAPIGASPEEIGRVLIKNIDAYERAQGGRRKR